MKPSINSILLLAGTLLGGFLVYLFAFGEVNGRGPVDGIEAPAALLPALRSETEEENLNRPLAERPAVEGRRTEMKQPRTKLQLARESKDEVKAEDTGPKLFGTVLAESGFAVAGAKIEVSATGKAKNLFGMIIDNFAKQATSDGAGNFEVSRSWITDDEVSIKITARGFEIKEEARAPSAPDGRADLGIIKLKPAVVLGGVVVSAANEPLEGAEVTRTERGGDGSQLFFARLGEGKLHNASTDAEGRFELPHEEVGEYDLIVEHEGYPQQRYEGSTPDAGGEDLGILIRMDASASLSGRIAGFPKGMQRILVQASPALRSEDEELKGIALFLPIADAKSPTAPVNADGSFELHGLVPSKLYMLKALQQSGFIGQVACSDELEVLSGSVDLTLTWETAASLSFRVEDSKTGEPIPEGSARFVWKGSASMMGDMPRQRKFKAGLVHMEELRPEPAPGELRVLLYAPGYQEYMLDAISIEKGVPLELPTVRMAPAALVRVRVVDVSTGKPLSRAYVELAPVQADKTDDSLIDGRKSDGNTDKEGWVSLDSCMTPVARMTVKKAGYGEYIEAALPMPRVGTEERIVELTPGGTVEAFVVDRARRPVKNSRVYAILGNGSQLMEETNSKGRARFKSLPPGEHRFRGIRFLESTKSMSFSADRRDQFDKELDWDSVSVASNATSSVTLVVPSASTLSGRISAAGKPLAGASVRVLQQRESKAEMDSEFEMASSMDGAFSGVSTSTKTDNKGDFSMDEVPVGRHVLYVVSQSGSVPHRFPVVIIEGRNYSDLVLPIARITGTVTDTDGEPISGAKISARRVQSGAGGPDNDELEMIRKLFGRGDENSVSSNSQGSFTIPNVSTEEKLVVRVSGKGFISGASEELTLAADEVYGGLHVELARAGSIRVKLQDPQSRFVMLSATYAGDEKNKPEDTSGQGWAQGGSGLIEGLAPGLWRVSVGESELEGRLVEVFAGSQALVNL